MACTFLSSRLSSRRDSRIGSQCTRGPSRFEAVSYESGSDDPGETCNASLNVERGGAPGEALTDNAARNGHQQGFLCPRIDPGVGNHDVVQFRFRGGRQDDNAADSSGSHRRSGCWRHIAGGGSIAGSGTLDVGRRVLSVSDANGAGAPQLPIAGSRYRRDVTGRGRPRCDTQSLYRPVHSPNEVAKTHAST